MAGMDQRYSCNNCKYQGTADAPANAAREVLLEAAEADHSKHSPDCSSPSIVLGSQSDGA